MPVYYFWLHACSTYPRERDVYMIRDHCVRVLTYMIMINNELLENRSKHFWSQKVHLRPEAVLVLWRNGFLNYVSDYTLA